MLQKKAHILLSFNARERAERSRMSTKPISVSSSLSSSTSATRFRAGQRRIRQRSIVTKASSSSSSNADLVANLNSAFSIPSSVSFECDSSPYVYLTHKNGCTAKVYLFGANCASWTQPSGDEVLFVRPDAKFDESVPIAGGIPICFPQFGMNGPMSQQHGFARNMRWEVIGTSADVNPDDPEPAVMLSLKSNEETKKMWPHDFECTYEVTLRRDKLKCEFCVKNCAEDMKDELEFTAALHSYIEVVDATDSENVYAKGNLKGKSYMDKEIDAKNPPLLTYDKDRVTIGTKLVDSIFLNTDSEMLLHVGNGAAVSVENTAGWRDFVVWNPHQNMPQCYKQFACVENACAVKPVVLPGDGYVWKSEMNLTVVTL